MNGARLVSRVAVLLATMATVAATPVAATRAAGAPAKVAWCKAGRLSLSAVAGPHAEQVQAGGAVLWFMQLRHRGRGACTVENRLTLVSARTLRGASIRLRTGVSYVFGPRREPLVLAYDQRAFVELWDPAIWTRTRIRGCKDRVVLTFGLPHGGGTLRTRPPKDLAMCPVGSMSISAPFSAGAFLQLMRRSDMRRSDVRRSDMRRSDMRRSDVRQAHRAARRRRG